MAEFCLKCFNKLNGTDYQASEVWLEEDFCEGCADWRPCIMKLWQTPLPLRLADRLRNLLEK